MFCNLGVQYGNILPMDNLARNLGLGLIFFVLGALLGAGLLAFIVPRWSIEYSLNVPMWYWIGCVVSILYGVSFIYLATR